MDRKSKTVFQLDTPYSAVQWPRVSPESQQIILELLTSLLSPIGRHRTSCPPPSKGKRSKKRKRQDARATEDSSKSTPLEFPPPPEISSHVLVGLGSITRHLEMLSRQSRVQGFHKIPEAVESDAMEIDSSKSKEEPPKHLAAVFVSRSSQPSVLHDHLPQLIAAASSADPSLAPIRLVQLPKGCEEVLCSSVGLPRAAFVAITNDAPHSKSLVDFLGENVPAIEVEWLKEAGTAQFMPVKINAIQTTVSAPRKGKPKETRQV